MEQFYVCSIEQLRCAVLVRLIGNMYKNNSFETKGIPLRLSLISVVHYLIRICLQVILRILINFYEYTDGQCIFPQIEKLLKTLKMLSSRKVDYVYCL